MQFARHMTFYLREGWISKALIAIETDPVIFSPINVGTAIDTLGIGKVMVNSLRYWLNAMDIVTEGTENSQVKLCLTPLGENIYKYDKYLERKGTLWILHYKLATAEEKATTWYWFFNIFNLKEFDEEEFLYELQQYIRLHGDKPISNNSLKKDFLCLKNTYVYDKDQETEEVISCPFRELKLMSSMRGGKVYVKNKPNINEISPQIFFYLILESLNSPEEKEVEGTQISIDDLVYKDKSVGKVLNLPLNDVYDLLYILDNLGYIKLHQKFGSNYITIIQSNKQRVLRSYYKNYSMD